MPNTFWDRAAAELRRLGVDTVLGFPADTPSLVDAAHTRADMRAVVARDQRMLGCMAAGYARIAGRPAAIEVSTGPSVLNSLVGLAELASLKLPAVLFTTSVARGDRGRGAFQEVSQRELLGQFAVWYHELSDPGQLRWAVRSALWQATGARPGLAVLEVPAEVGRWEPGGSGGAFVAEPGAGPASAGRSVVVPDRDQLSVAARMSDRARRPVIIVGGGAHAARAGAAVRRLAERLDAPVFATASGRGTVPEAALSPRAEGDNYCGLAGLYRDTAMEETTKQADLVLALGTRLEETARDGWADGDGEEGSPQVQLIRVDTDQTAELSGPACAVFLTGDARRTAELLADELAPLPRPDRSRWRDDWREARDLLFDDGEPGGAPSSGPGPVPLAPAVLRALTREFGSARWCLVQENGLHDLWGYHYAYLRLGPKGQALAPGEQTMMGFALPAALGVHLADPALETVVVCGDGALEASLGALATARRLGLGLTIIAWDNAGWGWPRSGRGATRDLMSFPAGSRTLPALATMFHSAARARTPAEFGASLATARAHARAGRLALVVVPVDDLPLSPAARRAQEHT